MKLAPALHDIAGAVHSFQRWGPASVRKEAGRCLFCFDAPCRADCPAGIDVPSFIRRILHENPRGASELIRRENPLGWLCGILCPVERLCTSHCHRAKMDKAIDIGGLQAFASGPIREAKLSSRTRSRRRVAVVGAGPSGLSAAFYLSQGGVDVDLFEANTFPGGLITFGIRPDKIEKREALKEMEALISDNRISLHLRKRVADPRQLTAGNDAVYVATGLGAEGVPGNLLQYRNVFSATAFLRNVNEAALRDRPYRKRLDEPVFIIGGGNTAMDAAITAKRLGAADVTVVYRRTEAEMPAWKYEIKATQNAGVIFRFLLEPASFRGRKDRLYDVVFRSMRLGDLGPDGRRKAIPVVGRTLILKAGTLILATGREAARPPWLAREAVGVSSGRLGESRVWIGGELRQGGGLIVRAVADGKRAAQEILTALEKRNSV